MDLNTLGAVQVKIVVKLRGQHIKYRDYTRAQTIRTPLFPHLMQYNCFHFLFVLPLTPLGTIQQVLRLYKKETHFSGGRGVSRPVTYFSTCVGDVDFYFLVNLLFAKD